MTGGLLISLLLATVPVQDTLQAGTVVALKESIPLSQVASPVSSIRPELMRATGTYRPNSLSGMVPGLHIPDYGASLTSTIYLRGLGSRMENPVLGLYVDGIPILDKNAYDFDWEAVRSVTLLRGPQGTLYGRNSMGGVLAIRTLAPSDGARPNVHLEYGTAQSVRAGASFTTGNHAFSATFRHTDGVFRNAYKQELCDPFDGLNARWKWEKPSGDRLFLSHVLSVGLSREGGFAYGLHREGEDLPVSYNDEASYRRLFVMDGFKLRHRGDRLVLDGTASVQYLLDDMRMDQDYTERSIFTLQQKQNSGAGTLEVLVRKADTKARWQPTGGVFAFFRGNHMHAPVTFKRDGIQTLILDNANAHIPADIGYLNISDEEMPVTSDFDILSWNVALFHQSVYRTGAWLLTAGVRIDYEGAWMGYDCLTLLHYRFIPTMKADKALNVPYTGSIGHSRIEVLPKLSVLYEAAEGLRFFSTLSKGYRSGGFNTQIFSDILQRQTMNATMKDLGVYFDQPTAIVTAEHTEYDPEEAWNMEVGGRWCREHFRAEVSAYWMEVRNRQLTVFLPGQSAGRMMTNSGRGRNVGVETEAEARVKALTLRAAWSWCRTDDGVPYVPEHTLFAGASYSIDLNGCRLKGDAFLRGAGPFWWNEEHSLQEPFSARLGACITLAFPKWEWYVRGENLTGTESHSFYFKSMEKEFFAAGKPRMLYTGISLNF